MGWNFQGEVKLKEEQRCHSEVVWAASAAAGGEATKRGRNGNCRFREQRSRMLFGIKFRILEVLLLIFVFIEKSNDCEESSSTNFYPLIAPAKKPSQLMSLQANSRFFHFSINPSGYEYGHCFKPSAQQFPH